jgi:N6-adenosine-specific RNA methylase IME4
MGFWFRGQVELCLFGIRGKIKSFRYQRANFIQCKVGKHSEKPQEFYDLIEPICLEPKLELFASRIRDGWTCIGFEANGQSVEEFFKCQ